MLWLLGYPEQALEKSNAALTLARTLSHPFSLAWALWFAASLHYFRREEQVTQELSEATLSLALEQGAPFFVAIWMILRGWALAEQGQGAEGILQIRQGLAAFRATGAEAALPWHLGMLADAHEKEREAEAGLCVVGEALALGDRTGECFYEAELYRLRGALMLQRATTTQQKAAGSGPRSLLPEAQSEGEAEKCFLKAIEIAQKQQAKSWELRASTNLARLWQHQGKQQEAHQLLSAIYGWFIEGFDTKDLQDAKALLDELTEGR
jgi:predicted ATPase